MYTSYYNLIEKPFQISTDPSFLWLGEKHKEALATLKYGVIDEKGFLLLTGAAGTGKTTLINSLLESLDDNTLVANVTDPSLDLMGFLNLITRSFGLSKKFEKKEEFIVSFKEFLRKTYVDNKRALLIIDEAHRLSKKLLEQSRLISNIELPEKKLINIFFVGQNELNQKLLSRDCHALRQRITLSYQIQPLSEDETLQYIHHRLKVAGNDKALFNREAISEIYRFSNGSPRLTNLICDHALITGYIREVKTITPDIIRECSQEVLLPGEVMEDSLSNFQKQPAADGLPQYLRPPPTKREGLKLRFLEEAKTRVRALKQGVRRNAGRFSRKLAKIKYIIIDLPTMVQRRPHLYGVFAVSIAVIVIVYIFLFQKDTVSKLAQPIPSVSALIASHWTHRGQALTATFGPPSSDKSKIPGLSSWEKGLFKKNNPDRKSDQKQAAPVMGTLEPSQNGTDRLFDSSTNAQRHAGATAGHSIDIPPAVQSETLQPASLQLAQEALKEKNFSRVIEFCEDALARQSKDLPQMKALYSRALRGQAAMFEGKDENKAELLLRKAVDVDPQSFEAYFDLGKLYTQSKDYPKAIKSYQNAIDLNPRSAKTAFNLGFVYATNQDYAKAEELFHRAGELKPPFLDKAIFNLAMVQQKQGKEQECVKNLNKALMINPDNHRARKYIEQLTGNSGVSR